MTEHIWDSTSDSTSDSGAINVDPFGRLIWVDGKKGEATFRSDGGDTTVISTEMATTIIGALAASRAINEKRAREAIYALRGGGLVARKKKAILDEVKEQIRDADAPTKAAGEWLTEATKMVGELMRELTENDET